MLPQGTLSFLDQMDLMLNASYIFIHGGGLRVGIAMGSRVIKCPPPSARAQSQL